MRMGTLLRNTGGSHEFGIKMLVCPGQRMNDLIWIIMGDDLNGFLLAFWRFKSLVRDRAYGFAD